ncbi:MAG: helix-hairpin-helix domain-containing protein [Bacteroidota bacterium]
MQKIYRTSYLLLFLWVLGCSTSLFAQIDTTQNKGELENTEFEQAVEDLFQNIDSEDQVDYSYISDQLEAYLERGLNINNASREELLFLPGMDDILVSRLLDHIKKFGKLASIYELQTIAGFRPDIIRQISPYISVQEIGVKNTGSALDHPQGPSLAEVGRNLKFEFIQRMVWIPEEQRGFTDPDTTFRDIVDENGEPAGVDTSLSSRYAGSPYRVYSRFQARYNPYVSVALVGEKDAGELFEWDPANKKYGYDFLSGHIAVQNYGRLKNLVIGDYTLQFGQGMILSRGLGFGKGAQVIKSVKMPNKGISPYRSVNENQFMRGVTASYAIKNFYLTAFYSRQFVDANIQARDTLNDEALLASSLQTSGFHRTLSEIANRKSIREQIVGGRAEWRWRNLRLGATHYLQRFNSEIMPAETPYNDFAFRGRGNAVSGVDVDWVYKNFNFFGEVGRSLSGGMGIVGGFMSSLSDKVDFALQARKFDKDFHSNKAYVFAERPTAAQNEAGLYMGLRIHFNNKWTLNTYFDQFYFPTAKFRAYYPSRGWEYMAQLEYKPTRETQVYARFRTDNQEQNIARDEAISEVNYLVPFQRNQFRIHFQTKISRDILYKSRVEYSRVQENGSYRGKGLLFYQDLSWKFGFKWRLTGRYAIFDIPLSDARIYAYENDVLGFFSIPAYRGTGSRYYLIFNAKPSRNLEFWFRIAQSRFKDVRSIGSGLSSIEGDTRSEIKLQMRIKF